MCGFVSEGFCFGDFFLKDTSMVVSGSLSKVGSVAFFTPQKARTISGI